MSPSNNLLHTAVGVVGVIFSGTGKILLTESEDRGWEPPGGFVNAGEPPIVALCREVLEETGCTVQPLRLSGIYCCQRQFPILSLWFRCRILERVTQETHESKGIGWVTPEIASELVTYSPTRLRLKDALSVVATVMFRHYCPAPFEVFGSWSL